MSASNSTPLSSCMYSGSWMYNRNVQNSWIREDVYSSQVTAPVIEADAWENNRFGNDESQEVSKPLREKNCRRTNRHAHVPHREKPPQVVAKRNARERRRVQAVNSAFIRLRKVVPMENNRGKRISKVKTLQHAIKYINRLQTILQEDGCYQILNPRYSNSQNNEFSDSLDFDEELSY